MLINVEHLKKVLAIQSYSNFDTAMMTYIKQYISGGLKLRYELDSYGNIYCTKGKKNYVGIVCHTDTVHDIAYEYNIATYKDIIYAFGKKKQDSPYGMLGSGGDDKVGVYICLQALKDLPDVKCVFYRNEEIGNLGSDKSNIDYLKDCSFIIECDRKGNSDFIIESGVTKHGSDEFANDAKQFYEKYNYTITHGVGTDVRTLHERGVGVSAINLSCGYYLPHTDDTYVAANDVDVCYSLVCDLYNNLRNKRYDHQYTKPTYSYGYTSRWNANTNPYGQDPAIMTSGSCVEEYNFIEKDSQLKLFEIVGLPLDYQPCISDIEEDVMVKLHAKPNDDFTAYKVLGADTWFTNDAILNEINYNYTLDSEHVEESEYAAAWEDGVIVKTTYVYSRFSQAWIKKDRAKWVEHIHTWVLK